MDSSEDKIIVGRISGRMSYHSLPQFSELRSAAQDPFDETVMLSKDMAEALQKWPSFASTNVALNAKTELIAKREIDSGLPEKELIQKNNQLIIPSVGQNNTVLGAESDCVPSSDSGLLSHELLHNKGGVVNMINRQKNSYKESQIQDLYDPCMIPSTLPVTQLLQGLQTSNLQQLVKEHIKQVKRELALEETEEAYDPKQTYSFNIPDVIKKHLLSFATNNFINSDRITPNLSDLNVHIETEQKNESNLQTVLKVEQQVQTDFPKPEKRKFRAKLGEVKVSIDCNGITHYYCPECSLEFLNKEDIEQHKQSHLLERKYQCKECGAMLKRKEHLDQHMRGHSDERPYKCHICQRAFKRNEHLTRHSVIHSGNKDFLCNICQKAFSRKDHLRKHKQTHLSNRKNKQKEEGSYYIDQKDSGIFDKNIDAMAMPNQEVSYFLKDNDLIKQEILQHLQETNLLHHLQNLEKNSNFLQAFTSVKEQVKDAEDMLQAQAINVNDSLSQNTKYIPQF